jgi:glycosyltransferase involved in cell wall biosynthesis
VLAQNFPAQPSCPKLFVDVTNVVSNDIHTGIQRVARAILRSLLLDDEVPFQIVPVRLLNDTEFGTVYSYVDKILSTSIPNLCERPIDVSSSDRFLVLDLDFGQNAIRQKILERYQDVGAEIWHVVYDLLPVTLPQYFPTGTSDQFSDWLKMVAKFDGAACISQATSNDLKEWLQITGHKTHPNLQITWFHLGADLNESVPTYGLPEDAESVLSQLKSKPTFLMVGTVEPRKGHVQVLNGFEKLWCKGVDVNLVIVGKKGWRMGPFWDRLTSHSERGKHLFWQENISDEFLGKIYAASSCLVAASEGEGFGLPLIEAAQHKLSILARKLPVFEEIAGVHATYFEGLEAENISDAVENWLQVYNDGHVLTSENMPWLTWKESTQQLLRGIERDEAAKSCAEVSGA